ncbi:MAG: hypothetical protein Fur0018_12900 [Anaerolineales bacterium]
MTRNVPRYLIYLIFFGLIFLFESAPGYMDADYYAANGVRIAAGLRGQGDPWAEPFLWHYLDDPQGLPHPSFSYWMPLPAWLGALGALLIPLGERAVRLPFVLLSAAVPLISAALAWAFTRRRESAVLAAFLALFSGFYLPFLPTSDAFSPLMLMGGAFFLLLMPASPDQARLSEGGTSLLLGVLVGLLHLTRAEGLLWLVVGGATVWQRFHWGSTGKGRWWRYGAVFAAGYLLTAGPWMLRNLLVFGTPVSPVGARALWWRAYDELYAYPASLLTPAHLLSGGWGEILRARLWALGQNLQTALAVQGSIFLLPLMLMGAWRLRRQPAVQIAMLAWGALLAVMTLLFPFAGARGGFFHAGAAVQPLLWALAPVGLESFIEWGGRHRNWQAARAGTFFRTGLIVLAALLSGLLLMQRVVLSDWGGSEAHYRQVEAALQAQGALPQDVVMVNNPPGYVLSTGRAAIAVPYGDVDTMLAVARRYGARYLVLEQNYRGGPLDSLYDRPPAALRLLTHVGDTLLFVVEGEE